MDTASAASAMEQTTDNLWKRQTNIGMWYVSIQNAYTEIRTPCRDETRRKKICLLSLCSFVMLLAYPAHTNLTINSNSRRTNRQLLLFVWNSVLVCRVLSSDVAFVVRTHFHWESTLRRMESIDREMQKKDWKKQTMNSIGCVDRWTID